MTSAILHLCQTCRPDAADHARASLQAALDAAGLPAQVRDQPCMNACERPVSLSLQASGYSTYFFTNVDPMKDRSDIVATVRLYLDSPKGWIDDARPCGRLRYCLTGRVPPISSEG